MENTIPETHESYATLGISRVSCSHGVPLFGSSVEPHHTIVLTISSAKRRRDFQKDWILPEKTLIEVEMSPAQFAEAITSLNVGSGTPVTLRYVNGDKKHRREVCPDENFSKKANSDLTKEMQELTEKLNKLSNVAREILSTKGNIKAEDKKTLKQAIDMLEQEVRCNIPYIHTCLSEAVTKTLQEAKSELDATVCHIKTSIGEKALAKLQQDGVVDVPSLNALTTPNDKENVIDIPDPNQS